MRPDAPRGTATSRHLRGPQRSDPSRPPPPRRRPL